MSYYNASSPSMLERIIAAASYLTMGFVGFVWLIIAVFTKKVLRPFLRYHVYQSIFLSIIYFLLSTFISLLFGILGYIPFLRRLVGMIAFFFNVPIFGHLSLISALILMLILYLAISAFMEKYSYIPWVSDVINYNVRR